MVGQLRMMMVGVGVGSPDKVGSVVGDIIGRVNKVRSAEGVGVGKADKIERITNQTSVLHVPSLNRFQSSELLGPHSRQS